ncbi:MAG: YHS domain-containing protein, partial [Acinetobacter sp.]
WVSVDPVCGMSVTDLSKPNIDYKGQRYYFCCSGCLNKFELDPEQYLLSAKVNEPKKTGCGCASKAKTEEKKTSCCAPQDQQAVAQSSGCCAGSKPKTAVQSIETVVDPVCGMQVKTDAQYHSTYQDQDYYFCSERCLSKFNIAPEQYVVLKTQSSSCCVASTPTEPKKQSSCCAGGHSANSSGQTEIDPVCGMSVETSTDLKTDYQNKTYYFCNPSCLDKFKQDPEFYLIPLDERPVPEGAADMDYTCPMDPEIVQKGPGTCPICGMALEPMQPTLDDAPNPELVDFSHRFWMTLPLTLIVFVLAMGSHIHAFIPQHIQPWIELVLSIPVVLWAGKPIIERCWTSYKTRNLNMWSLIGVGVLAAFIYSVVAT